MTLKNDGVLNRETLALLAINAVYEVYEGNPIDLRRHLVACVRFRSRTMTQFIDD